jgi:hypothetical protein
MIAHKWDDLLDKIDFKGLTQDEVLGQGGTAQTTDRAGSTKGIGSGIDRTFGLRER